MHARPAIVHPRGSNAHLRSDNQTRRPGAVNYTGPSFKDTESAHGVPDAPPVSLAGDHFESHTGARTTGPIAVRAASSNEMDIVKRPVPTARGGGPAAGPYVVAPGGHIEMLAPSRPLAWSANMPRLAVKAPSALSLSDVRSLPYRGDGTAHRRATGLLSMMPRVGPGHLIDTMGVAGAEPTRERAAVGFGARATGGGPRARSVDSNGR